MSSKTEKSQNVITKGDVKKAIRAAPNSIKPNHVGSYTVSTVQGLGPCIIVPIVPSAGHAAQLVIHRPIGVTKLDKGQDWVMSPSSDVDLLLGRAKDPSEATIRLKQQANRTDFLIAKGLVEKVDDVVFYKGVKDKTRNEFLHDAEQKLKAFQKEKKTSKGVRSDFIDKKVVEKEQLIAEVLKTAEAIAAVEKDAKSTFETRGGLLDNEPQVAIPGLRGMSLIEVMARFPKLIVEGIGRGKQVQVTSTVTVTKEVKSTSLNDVRALAEHQFNDWAAEVNNHIGDAVQTCGELISTRDTLKAAEDSGGTIPVGLTDELTRTIEELSVHLESAMAVGTDPDDPDQQE